MAKVNPIGACVEPVHPAHPHHHGRSPESEAGAALMHLPVQRLVGSEQEAQVLLHSDEGALELVVGVHHLQQLLEGVVDTS